MQAPLLVQPDKPASLQRDRAIWADKCIQRSLRWADFMVSHRPSARIARSRMRDLISASLSLPRSQYGKPFPNDRALNRSG